MIVSKYTISRFRRKAGLFFFIISIIWILAGGNVVQAEEEPSQQPPVQEPVSITQAATEPVPADAQSLAASEQDPVIVVIDPGHGGENLGGEYEDYTEKEMTLIVANAMKAELEQYEGIKVYLTRTGDEDLTLDERCEYAASVNADFLFCLHFNMSAYHTLFGAETWISAFGEGYSKGYSFASIEMELLQNMGLYSRGIKTRLNDAGVDYYGIIRHSRELNFPCVLIEHCHLDQENDQPFYDHKEKLEAFGRLDAEAVAKYFGLRSESLNKDYSSYQPIQVPVPTQVMKPDSTPPDICMIDLADQNGDTGEVTLSVSAVDYDSGMLYYTYSYDGGNTFSDLQKWPDKNKDTFEFSITVPSGVVPQMVVNAYNGYDLYTTSNMLNLPSMSYGQEEEVTPDAGEIEAQNRTEAQSQADADKQTPETDSKIEPSVIEIPIETEEEPQPVTVGYFLKVCLICAALVLAMALSIIVILRNNKKRRKRRRR
ncbi:MAG: N-acetylmuramoyl-L-alanine amidase [Clostridium sp.]|nr:N-acetylmuramoyl-L-alanine amidase [Clostridium sp.]